VGWAASAPTPTSIRKSPEKSSVAQVIPPVMPCNGKSGTKIKLATNQFPEFLRRATTGRTYREPEVCLHSQLDCLITSSATGLYAIFMVDLIERSVTVPVGAVK